MSRKYRFVGIAVLLIVMAFAHNGGVSLWDQDEAAYAGISRQMYESGDWLMQDFTWSEIHRKPPFHFWSITVSYHIFGVNEFAVRLPSALFFLGTLSLLFFWGKRLWGERIAGYSTLILASSLLVPLLAKVSVTDGTLLFFTTACCLSLLQMLRDRKWLWVFTFWVSFSVGVLVKGPAIIIVTGTLAVLLLVFHEKRKVVLRLHPWFFLPLALAPLILWGWMTTKVDGGVFLDWMIDWYILSRVGGSVLGQEGPPGTHLLILFVSFLPFVIFSPRAFWNGLKGMFKGDSTARELGCWLVAGWLMWEFSPSKLPAYAIASHVPFAILIARQIVAFEDKFNDKGPSLPPIKILIVSVLPLAVCVVSFVMPVPNALRICASLALIIFLYLIFRHYRSKDSHQAMEYYVLACFGFMLALLVGVLPLADQLKDSTRRTAQYSIENAHPNSKVVIGNTHGKPPSLPFYLTQAFESVVVEKRIDLLDELLRDDAPAVLVLSHQQITELEERYPNLQSHAIESFAVDRTSKMVYHVVLNAAAQNQE